MLQLIRYGLVGVVINAPIYFVYLLPPVSALNQKQQ